MRARVRHPAGRVAASQARPSNVRARIDSTASATRCPGEVADRAGGSKKASSRKTAAKAAYAEASVAGRAAVRPAAKPPRPRRTRSGRWPRAGQPGRPRRAPPIPAPTSGRTDRRGRAAPGLRQHGLAAALAGSPSRGRSAAPSRANPNPPAGRVPGIDDGRRPTSPDGVASRVQIAHQRSRRCCRITRRRTRSETRIADGSTAATAGGARRVRWPTSVTRPC